MYKELIIVINDRFSSKSNLKQLKQGLEKHDYCIHTEFINMEDYGIKSAARKLQRIFYKESVGFNTVNFIAIGTGYYILKYFLRLIDGNRKIGKSIVIIHENTLPYDKMVQHKWFRTFFGPSLITISNKPILNQICGTNEIRNGSLVIFANKYSLLEKLLSFIFKSNSDEHNFDRFTKSFYYSQNIKRLCGDLLIHEIISEFLNDTKELAYT